MHDVTLPNGLRLLVEPSHASRVVAVQIWVRVGSADEGPDEAGLAHLHEHMLFKGTASRGVGELASEIEAAGGEINAWTSFDQTVYHVTIASRELDVALDVLADAVRNSTFDPEELEREIEVVIEELHRGRDQPARVAGEMLFSGLYRRHPYGRPVIGTLDSVRSMTRDKVLRFYDRWYRPGNMTVVVAGDVEPARVEARIRELFDGDSAPVARPARPVEPPLDEVRVAVQRKDIQETHLFVGWSAVPLADPRTPYVDLLSVILGAGESSRLYRRVKRELERVNDCYALSHTPDDPGLFAVGAQVHGDGVLDALESLLETSFAVRDGVTDDELEKARTIILSEQVYLRETVDGMARRLGYFASTVGDVGFEEAYYRAIREATATDVADVARQLLKPDALVITALLPNESAPDCTESAIRERLERVRGPAPTPSVTPGEPELVETVLSNGAKVVIREDRTVPRVAIRAAAIGGLLAERRQTSGVGHLTSQLLVRGTRRRSAEELVELCDAMAAGLGGISGRSSLGLSGDFLQAHWDRGFDLFMDCLLEPTFPEAELERERRTALEDVAARKDSPTTMVFDRLAEVIHADHPYSLPVLGHADSLAALTRDAIERAWRTQLAPSRTVVAVVGAVDPRQTLRRLEATLGAAPPGEDFELPAPAPPPEAQELEIPLAREQAHVVVGFPGVSLSDPRRMAMDVLATVLGGQSGRLFLDLRDRQSLAYSVSALHLDGYHPGSFAVYIGTSPGKVAVAETGMIGHLRAVVEDGITRDELERAQRYLIGAHEIGLQRASARAGSMALMEAYGEGWDAYLRYADRLMAVDRADVKKAAAEILRLDRPVRIRLRSPASDSAA